MSNTTSYRETILPKFKDCKFQSNETSENFERWSKLLSTIVSSHTGGKPLARFLDYVMDRDVDETSTIPSFMIKDERFARHAPDAPRTPGTNDNIGESPESIVNISTPTGSSSFEDNDPNRDAEAYPKRYYELAEESKMLDKNLYNMLLSAT